MNSNLGWRGYSFKKFEVNAEEKWGIELLKYINHK
jgi:hypothetical protein